eukprot:CAMPEP_0168204718 /NCGR_PEP_ID=MMETSP0139_2-20121125/25542_1 /TAXON_ID=44445 /ORGANISM="Pseudo-nitzschia australis, Strain 10249 10 AB" /LENGTH=730 /DNA_ID=CAMNT_0008130665 /DNA_START=237 /DNA_END=2429 /DNA_ORIENTATION=+
MITRNGTPATSTTPYAPNKEKQQGRRSSSSFPWTLEWIFKCLLSTVGIFYLGIWAGWRMHQLDYPCDCNVNCNGGGSKSELLRGGLSSSSGSSRSSSSNNSSSSSGKNVNINIDLGNNDNINIAISNKDNGKVSIDKDNSNNDNSNNNINNGITSVSRSLEKTSAPLSAATVAEHNLEIEKLKQQLKMAHNDASQLKPKKGQKAEPHHREAFTRNTRDFLMALDYVDRDEFGETFDTGGPFDLSWDGNNRVAILYSDGRAFPPRNATTKKYPKSGEVLSVADATKNCINMHVVMTSDSRKNQCIAIVGQYEGFHLQKFMRMTEGERIGERNSDLSVPLRLVNRGMQLNGERSHVLPEAKKTTAFWKLLTPYLDSLSDVLKELKPIAKSVASHNQHNAIVVVVCNFGHAEMLLNFICHARAQGKETLEALDNVLVFATDLETHELVTSMGLTSFYSETVFGNTPSEAAQEYGDERYSRIMLSKVYCVHLVSQLGYDLLFQDVDVIWYKDPLTWFHQEDSPSQKYDIIFQDDGARTLFYAPYSANTGFYYVRNNRRTQNFFNSLLMAGDQILTAASHQSVMITLLAEQASLYALKVKTWNRRTTQFPGGHAFHKRPRFMKQLANRRRERWELGEPSIIKNDGGAFVHPYVFHMSWTVNKDNKLKYFEQMGEWHLNHSCNSDKNGKNATHVAYTPANCCTAKPLVQCHYRDKASIVPCRDAPPATKENLASFW